MENLKKKVQVVMFPTNEKANILKRNNYLTVHCANWEPKGLLETGWNYQHLYFLSDEKIKEGDWCIQNGAWLCKITCNRDLSQSNLKKIIASTNKSLNLPQPPPAFVKVFIEEWNKGNKIKWVMVNYEELKDEAWKTYLIRLKVDKNNDITITKVKDSWSREEVRNIAYAMYCMGRDDLVETKEQGKYVDNFNKWIEENL